MKKYLLILLVLCSLCFGIKPISIYNSTPAVVLDESGNGNTGDVHGATLGKDGMSFDGITNPVVLNSEYYTSINGTAISFWLNPNNYGGILGWTNAFTHNYILMSGADLHGETIINGDHFYCTYSNVANVWSHYVFIFTNNFFSTYVNGSYYYNAGTGEMTTNLAVNVIGSRQTKDAMYGNIKNFAWYNRVPTSNEVVTLVNAGRNASMDTISTNDLVLFYDFSPDSKPVTINSKPVVVE